jgi:hypothetical protein
MDAPGSRRRPGGVRQDAEHRKATPLGDVAMDDAERANSYATLEYADVVLTPLAKCRRN